MVKTPNRRLTAHQTDALARLVKWNCRTGRPVPLSDIGSRGAYRHLEEKGMVTISVERGPRGGEIEYVAPLYAEVPSRLAVNAILVDGDEVTCESCGEVLDQGSDGNWIHFDTDRVRCWPGKDFVATPAVNDEAAAGLRLDRLQEQLDEETKPYGERRLVVRRVPEHGWAVYDRDSGQKMRPLSPDQWFASRTTALAAKTTEAGLVASPRSDSA